MTSVSVFSCKFGSTVKLELMNNRFKGPNLRKLFEAPILMPQDNDDLPKLGIHLAIVKFLRHEPKCASYTALVISENLNTFIKRMDSDTIETNIDEVTTVLSGYFPPYLKSKDGYDIQQVTKGRVIIAAEFLDKIQYLLLRRNGQIICKRSKGAMIDDIPDYFMTHEARLMVKEAKNAEDKKSAELQREKEKLERSHKLASTKYAGAQKQLEEFFKK